MPMVGFPRVDAQAGARSFIPRRSRAANSTGRAAPPPAEPSREALRSGRQRSPLARVEDEPREKERLERPWRVWLHNDDYTPMEYVTQVLHDAFGVGWLRALRVMLKAHVSGRSEVALYPRREAEERVSAAHARARGAGWPLHFSAEPAE